jgi:hypothetical protein
MKEKLTKEELLEQLEEIEKQEKLDREEKFYNTYKDLSFFKTLIKTTNWQYILIVIAIIEILCLFNKNTQFYIMFGAPLYGLFITVLSTFEFRLRIKYIKRSK